MAVSIECWRIRIGTHASRCFMIAFSQCGDAKPFLNSLCLFLVLCMLLLIGNIESNPGPSYKCKECGFIALNLFQDSAHQRLHSNKHNFVFTCSWPLCKLQFQTFKVLESHLRRARHEEGTIPEPPQQVHVAESLSCNFPGCLEIVSSFSTLCAHIFRAHFNEEGAAMDTFSCPFPNCDRTAPIPNKKALSTHLGQYHKGWKTQVATARLENEPSTSRNIPGSHEMEVESVSTSCGISLEEEVTEETGESFLLHDNVCSDDVMHKFVAQFYLFLEGELLLPSSTVQKISEHLAILSEVIQNKLRSVLLNELSEFGLDKEKVLNTASKILSSDPLYSTHHKNCLGPDLTTEFLRHEYYKKNFLYIEPTEYYPGEDRIAGEAIQYTPIEESLKMLLADPSVQQQVEESFNVERESSEFYTNYTDGSVCKDKHSHQKKRIDLLLFVDGFSVTNPLGSAKKKHRMEGTYFTLGNFEPHKRSKLDAIHLVSMVSKDLLTQYGHEKCYKPLFVDLQRLANEGINFMGEMVPVVLMFVIGDNLGQHQLGGFVESFSSTYFCRFCTISKQEFKTDPLTLKSSRTAHQYHSHLEKARSLNRPIYKGIKFNSIINSLKNVHVCDPRLAVCIAHDLFHGVASWDLSAFLKYLIEKKNWFSYKLLNRRIAQFKCNDGDSPNKPAQVSECGSKLGGHAVQNWTLVRILPFILGDLIVDPSDKVWCLYLKLKELCELICAPVISLEQINLLKKKTCDYLQEAKEFIKFKPKHHFVLHYSDLIPKFGPLIHLATLRFESKHAFFKRIVRASNNFINVPRTLILRHQLHVAYLSTGHLFSQSVKPIKLKPLNTSDHEEDVADVIVQKGFSSSAQTCDAVNIGDLSFKKGQWLITSTVSDTSLEIACIKAIIILGTEVHLVLSKHQALFLPSYGIFKIEENVKAVFCSKSSELRHPLVQPVYNFMGDLCFSLKHSIIST